MKKFLVFLVLATALLWPEGVLLFRAWLWSVLEFYLTSDAIYMKFLIISGIFVVVLSGAYLVSLVNRDPNSLPPWTKVPVSEDPTVAAKQFATLFTVQGFTGVTIEVSPAVFRVESGKSAKVLATLPDGRKKIIKLMDGTPCLKVSGVYDGGLFLPGYRLPGSGNPFSMLESGVGVSLCEFGQEPARASYSDAT